MEDEANDKPTQQHVYRAKLVDADGRIETTVAILASSEADALEQVRGLALSYAVELWNGGQLIASMPLRTR